MGETEAARLIQARWNRVQSRRHARLCGAMRERLRCVVCYDETPDLVMCPNGHGCCVGCDLGTEGNACPMCRDPRGARVDETQSWFATRTGLALRCGTCTASVRAADCERHRAWCPAHKFVCPHPRCGETMALPDLRRHLLTRHEPAVIVPQDASGRYVVLLLAPRYVSEAVLHVDDSVVMVGTRTMYRSYTNASELVNGQMSVTVRCYYPSDTSRAWRAVVRQRQVADGEREDAWLEEFHVGVVAPVLASREHVTTVPYAPLIVPRCIMSEDAFEAPNSRDAPVIVTERRRLREAFRDHSVRDLPRLTRPHVPPTLAGMPVAILEVLLTRDPVLRIGDLYNG